MARILVHTNWTNTIKQTTEISLEDLRNAKFRELLKSVFSDPERLKPSKTRQSVTEDAATEFADLARRLPSTESRDYGRPFAEVFAAVNKDFYAIDPLLFAPARAVVTALGSGRSFHGGRLAPDMLDRSFDGTEGGGTEGGGTGG